MMVHNSYYNSVITPVVSTGFWIVCAVKVALIIIIIIIIIDYFNGTDNPKAQWRPDGKSQ